MTTTELNNERQALAEKVARMALANGLSLEQVMANPQAAFQAFLDADRKAHEKMKEQVYQHFKTNY